MNAAERLRAAAPQIARRVAACESTFLSNLGEQRWNDRWWQQYREPTLRVAMHRDALAALAGASEPGPDQLGQVSDWLRICVTLLFTVRFHFMDGLRKVLVAEVRRELKALPEPGEVLSTLDSLAAELPASVRAFFCLGELHQIPAFTPIQIARYWDAAARTAALFTIDWACFGRQDLFEATGRRAASWLVDECYARPSDRILQIGCGAGRIERYLAPQVAQVYGVDISKEMVKLAQARLAGLANVTVKQSDGRTLPFPDRSMTTVFSFLVFIHIHDPKILATLLEESFRVLEPGGRCAVSLNARDEAIEAAARNAGFSVRRAGPVPSRQINSFAYEPDWLLELESPS